MQFYERHHENRDQHHMPGGPGGSNLNEMRQTGESLFHGAEDAISRALSGDSLAFLGKTEQESGE